MRANSPRFVALVSVAVSTMALTAPSASNAAGMTTATTLNRTIAERAVVESSGLARSNYQRAVVWTHNDSGGSPTVYAVAKSGETRAVVQVAGASARDWEDISSGPNHTIWVGDVGDNNKIRSTIQVYRFAEPRELVNRSVTATRFDFAYPDGRHDAEGIMVNPVTGRLYIVTKASSGAGIYAAPDNLSTSSVNRLTRIKSAPHVITAASFDPDGQSFVLCNYGTAYRYRGFGDATPLQIDKPSLRQGESLTVNRSGKALLMGSEGSNSPVYRVELPGG